MNNISTLLPMISIDFDPNTAPAGSEPAESSPDDFASMLASVWCAPVAPQQPAPEVVVEPEAANTTATFAAESPAVLIDAPPGPVAPMPAADIMIPQPLLTFSDKPVVLESTIAEQGAKKIAIPDISLPGQKGKKTDDSKDAEVTAMVIDQAPINPNGPPLTPIVPATDGFAPHPINGTVADPLVPKDNIPTRRPPTFIEPIAASTTNNEVAIPEAAQTDVTVSVPKTSPSESTNPTPPDQVTAEAIKREANLAASYLAQSTRDSRESTFEGLKAQVSGNGSDSRSNDSDGDANPKGSAATLNPGLVNFTATLNKQSVETVKQIITPQVASQLVDLAGATQPRQQRSVRLRLRPEELGQIDIELSRDSAGKVSAQVTVERDSARTALTQSLPQLRETLERAGLQVDQLNVSSDASSFAGSSRENGQPANESSRSSSMYETSTSASETQSKERVREHKLLSLSA
jgi:flagellar hook-length control protein FliK